MIFYSNFTKHDIEWMTYAECETYVEFYAKEEEKKYRSLGILITNGSFFGSRSKVDATKKYLRELSKEVDEEVQENDIEDQFKGLNFG